jgi:thiol:disulfide interchange protein DsbC
MSPLLATAALLALFPAAATEGMSVEEQIAARIPGIEAEQVRQTPIAGLWEVSLDRQVVYVSEDGRYLVRGDIVDLMTSRNLTDERLGELHELMAERLLSALENDLDEGRMVVFSPDKPKHTVTVFTDIDCVYCRRLHREIEEYNERGIKVRYVFLPLAGPGSSSWSKAEAVWCSADRNDAMTRAKLGENVVATGPCEDTPVAEHYRISRTLGIQGTPGLVTEDGEYRSGYLPPEQLAAWLDSRGGTVPTGTVP